MNTQNIRSQIESLRAVLNAYYIKMPYADAYAAEETVDQVEQHLAAIERAWNMTKDPVFVLIAPETDDRDLWDNMILKAFWNWLDARSFVDSLEKNGYQKNMRIGIGTAESMQNWFPGRQREFLRICQQLADHL